MESNLDDSTWKSWSWKTKDRYYNLNLAKNLFGEWQIIKKWGGLRNRIHGSKTMYAKNLVDANLQLNKINKKRKKRGYHITS